MNVQNEYSTDRVCESESDEEMDDATNDENLSSDDGDMTIIRL